MNKKTTRYVVSVDNLKRIAIDLHLAYLHKVQEQMIEEALAVSDWKESKAVIKHIMEIK